MFVILLLRTDKHGSIFYQYNVDYKIEGNHRNKVSASKMKIIEKQKNRNPVTSLERIIEGGRDNNQELLVKIIIENWKGCLF